MTSRSFRPHARLRARQFKKDPMADVHGDMPKPLAITRGEYIPVAQWNDDGVFIEQNTMTRRDRIISAIFGVLLTIVSVAGLGLMIALWYVAGEQAPEKKAARGDASTIARPK